MDLICIVEAPLTDPLRDFAPDPDKYKVVHNLFPRVGR